MQLQAAGAPHLSLIRALAQVMLRGYDCEVRCAILKGVPEGCIGARRLVAAAIAAAAVWHGEAAGHCHPTLPARVIPCAATRLCDILHLFLSHTVFHCRGGLAW